MTETRFQLTAIGNAIVDVLSHTSEEFIRSQEPHGMHKGHMMLIDENRAKDLYSQMGQAVEVSGGSAANTLAGFASFGGKAAFIGKVADDQLGEVFTHDMRAQGVTFDTPPLTKGPETARCLILVTPDANRTMNTYLGACTELSPEDVDEFTVSVSEILYLEGYLFDKEKAKASFRKACDIAHASGRNVALSLSDGFCVDRHRQDFKDLIESHVDILFANEDEIKSLYEVDTFEEAIDAVIDNCGLTVLTRSEKGSLILNGNERHEIQAIPPKELVDTTGAGDMYAAGFLYGYVNGKTLPECGHLGSLAAAEVISHMGPRPETPLSDLIKNAA